jgi:hypothetical protein
VLRSPGRRRSSTGARAIREGSVFGRRSCEVSVFEAVAVASEGENVGVVNKAVGHGCGGDLVQALNGLLLVTIGETRS